MAGGPPARKQNSELRRMNIDVTGGAVQMGAFLEGNTFQGDVTSRTNYTGDGTINIRNEGSQSHQIIAHGNTFGGGVVFEQNINIQPPGQNNNEERNEEQMDLR
ncbi:hypothetical protein PGIGA_G00257440 [Pangasianodon gigas]|uniref:Uncharacterized protein n=1 Tax=Pangasianodon gigas TaxID=30993 RepID=A0ACC5WS60_PANGG|nr:hypothetical protein [Pangasianodon gigas]